MNKLMLMAGGRKTKRISLDFSALSDGAIPGFVGDTFAVSGGVAINTPSLSANLIINGDMELTTNWDTYNSASTNERSSEQFNNGSYSRKIITDGVANRGCNQTTASQTIGDWFAIDGYAYNSGALVAFNWDSASAEVRSTDTEGSWTNLHATRRKQNASNTLYLMAKTGDPTTAYFDDVYIKKITFSSMGTGKKFSISDVVAKASISVVAGNMAGVWICQDVSRQNGLIAYHDGTNAVLAKLVNGAYTELISAAAGYVSGADIEIQKSVSTVKLYYNEIQIGSDQTVSDASIINNKIHGLFSSYAGNEVMTFEVSPF